MSSGQGLFAAQNMMYRHTITIYNEKGTRLAKIKDGVNLKDYGFDEYEDHNYLGGPVEAAFTSDGKYLWVSNYSMVGPGFENEGCDGCMGKSYDPSFLYKINCSNFEIEAVVKVGAVPKFIAISDDDSKLLVSNWTSNDVSVVDLQTEKEVNKVDVAAHPRGMDITKDGKTAFVTIMGSTKLAQIDLETYEVNYITQIGRSPRHLILTDNDSSLLVSMNSGSKVVKYNRFTQEKITCKTPSGPRSMTLSENEDYLYVVNYFDHSFSKIRTHDMQLIETIATAEKPIGICGNWEESEIWVACYSGKIEVFKDFHLDSLKNGNSIFGIDLSSFWKPRDRKLNSADSVEVGDTSGLEVNPDTLMVNDEPLIKLSSITPKSSIDESASKNADRFKNRRIPESGENCQFFVISGAFSVPENASKQAAELDEKGYQCEIIQGAKLTYVAPLCSDNREDAEAKVKLLKDAEGFSAWILKR